MFVDLYISAYGGKCLSWEYWNNGNMNNCHCQHATHCCCQENTFISLVLTLKISDLICLSEHSVTVGSKCEEWIQLFKGKSVQRKEIIEAMLDSIHTSGLFEVSVFWFSGQISRLDGQIMRFSLCSQVSYFEIYLDKIRDLLDGKWLKMYCTSRDRMCCYRPFTQQIFWLLKAWKAHVDLKTLVMAALYFGWPVSVLGYCACPLTGMT